MAIPIILRSLGRFIGKGGKLAGRATKKIGAGVAKLGTVAVLAKNIFGGNRNDESAIGSAGKDASDAAKKISSSGVSEYSSNLAKSLRIYSIDLQNSITDAENKNDSEKPIAQSAAIPSIVPEAPNVKELFAEPKSGFARFVQRETEIIQTVRENEEKRIRASKAAVNNDPLGILLKGIKKSAVQLEENTEDNIDETRRENLKAKREEEEQKLEGGIFSDVMENVFGKVKDFAGNVKDGILAALTPFAPAAALLGTGLLMDAAGGDDEINIEKVLDNINETAERVTQLAAPAIIRNTVIGAKTSISTRIAKFNENKLGARVTNFASSSALKISAKVKPTSARYQKILQNLTTAKNWLVKAGDSFNKTTASAQAAVAKLPEPLQKLLGRLGRFAFRWFMFVEIADFLIRSTQAVMMGTITNEEWHKGNKEQLYKLIRLFGAPIVGMIILGLAGTPVAGLGGLVGGAAGLILGIILGESLFYVLNMEALVNGFYDAFFLGKWSTLIGYGPALVKRLMIELPILLGKTAFEAIKSSINLSPAVLAFRAVKDATADRAATEEEIIDKYGEGISNAELLQKAGEGTGTDENAILYAFKDINTPEKYFELKTQFEEAVLPEINENRIRKFKTMEQYLRKELSSGEYKQLMQQVTGQMQENSANEASALTDFFREVGYEYEEPIAVEETPEQTIPGIDDATEEKVLVITKGGATVLMTEQEILDSDNIEPEFKQAALETIRRKRNQNIQESQALQPETGGEETPVTDLNRTANDLQDTRIYLRDMAARMGLETSGEITGKLVGGVPVEVNGQRVPLSLFTAEERQKISAVEETRRAMEPVTRQQQTQPSTIQNNESELQQTQNAVVENSEIINRQIIPVTNRLNRNINILNRNELANQRRKTPPAGSEGMSSISSATPTRKTSDPFIEIAYMT